MKSYKMKQDTGTPASRIVAGVVVILRRPMYEKVAVAGDASSIFSSSEY